MRSIFADTSFLVSFHNKKDKNHKNAKKITKTLEGTSMLWVISDYIFDEFLTVLLVRRDKQFAIEVGQAILNDPNISLVRITEEIFNDAWRIFQKNRNQDWSFTDSTSFILIQKMNITEAVSFDKHFEEFGIKILK